MAFIDGGSLTDKLITRNEITPVQAGQIIGDGLPWDAYMNFLGADGSLGVSTILDSIPGYPDDLPRLQLYANADLTNPRLCFYEYPVFVQNVKNWVDFELIGSTGNQLAPLTRAMFLVDWNPMQVYGWKVAATPDEILAEKAAYCVGRVYKALNDATVPTVAKNRPATINDAIVTMVTPKVPGTQTISALPVDRLYWYGGQQGYLTRYPWQWIFENIQFYINKYLKVPYVITDVIPYGSNWQLQFQNATTGRKYNLVTAYLNGCNFLVQPLGKMDFWDKFYLAVPILITTVASIESGGAYAPALIAAVGSFVKNGEANSQAVAANTTNIEALKDSSPNQSSTAIGLDILTQGFFSSLTGAQLFGIVAVIIIIFIVLYKNSK